MVYYVRNKVNMGVIGKPWEGMLVFMIKLEYIACGKLFGMYSQPFIASEAQ